MGTIDSTPSTTSAPSSLAPAGPRRLFGLMRNVAHQNLAGSVVTCTEDSGASYDLAIVEFDDQGLFYDRRQMDALQGALDRLQQRRAVIVVFVHGWKHDGRSDDENLESFRTMLAELALVQAAGDRRPVLGVFVAWRGMSWFGPLIVETTFWGRKEAAFRIALGSVRELLGRLRQYRSDEADARGNPLLVIVGYSFGGLLVYSAVAQSLIEAAATQSGKIVPAFADLVLLVNPAFEAARYLAVHEQIERRVQGNSFVTGQRPVFISVTATNDTATGFWFRLGMAYSTLGESTRNRYERQALTRTMGHLEWMKTHTLTAPGVRTRANKQKRAAMPPAKVDPASRMALQRQRSVDFAHDPTLGKTRLYDGGALLTHVALHPYNPFWVVQASKEVIDGHNGIFGEVFAAFVWSVVTEHLG